MKRFFIIALNFLVWCVIIAYLVVASRYCSRQLESLEISSVKINIVDKDSTSAVSERTVREILHANGMELEGTPLSRLDAERARQILSAHPYIKEVSIHSDLEGKVFLEISQRYPRVRFMTERGDDFYVTDDMHAVPVVAGVPEYVPIITGNVPLPFEKGAFGALSRLDTLTEKKSRKYSDYLSKLINFVRLTESDEFWRAQIVQYDVIYDPENDWKEPEIELIPRVGNHIIRFGSADDVTEKLAKMKLFYDNVLAYEGWEKYKYINIKYKDQVVCTN